MTKWKLSDYKDYYEERAGIIENDKILKRYSDLKANNLAWRGTKEFFINNENLVDDEVLDRVKELREFIYNK